MKTEYSDYSCHDEITTPLRFRNERNAIGPSHAVVIDAGHGGYLSKGNSTAYGGEFNSFFREKDILLAITSAVRNRLAGKIPVMVTRTDDYNISLRQRSACAYNRLMFVSVHANPQSTHSEVWIHPCATTTSYELATSILNAFYRHIQHSPTLWEGNIAVLTPSYIGPIPACCIELGCAGYARTDHRHSVGDCSMFMEPYIAALSDGIFESYQLFTYPRTSCRATYGGLAHMLAPGIISFGVPAGLIIRRFGAEAVTQDEVRSTECQKHRGIDISLSSSEGGGAHDLRRGLEVYATPRQDISAQLLGTVQVYHPQLDSLSTGDPTLPTQNLSLSHGIVTGVDEHVENCGGRVTIAYHFNQETPSTQRIEFLVTYDHLITDASLPFDGQHTQITEEQWRATGKGKGFGTTIKTGNRIDLVQLTGKIPLIIGYLGATSFPHVHIECSYRTLNGTLLYIDPALVLR